ncbi:hypothetical protein [Thioclava sp. GXIMD4216]|uniref:Uncharacterized protein n=1 Tax=Thioclava litoralis TaxID=3076557 RepID=A0ABZ1DZ49_9RHOB|nr:hypothetical protein RPE78_12115 [Thioclava sp. FTW29]
MISRLGPNNPPSEVERKSAELADRRILVIEPTMELPHALRGVTGAAITIARLTTIDAALIERTAPDLVLSPLLSEAFDILDLARVMIRYGYNGPLRAYSLPLPNADLIRREVRQIWPNGDFDIFEIPNLAPSPNFSRRR